MLNKKYGWMPDIPDHRDLYFLTPTITIPPKKDLRKGCPTIYNQGQLGSCTANALGAAHQFEQLKQNTSKGSFIPSRLFIYYNERKILGTINEDSGARIRDGIKSLVKQGVCPESEWVYDVNKFTQEPSFNCYQHALSYQVLSYGRVLNTLMQLKSCLSCGKVRVTMRQRLINKLISILRKLYGISG